MRNPIKASPLHLITKSHWGGWGTKRRGLKELSLTQRIILAKVKKKMNK